MTLKDYSIIQRALGHIEGVLAAAVAYDMIKATIEEWRRK